MIFFIISTASLGNRSPQTLRAQIAPATIAPRKWVHNKISFIAWSEIYDELADLLSDVLDVAEQDPVCQLMVASAKQLTGYDPMDDSETQWLTLLHWAHPMVGNIMHSPQLRSSGLEQQMEDNWERMPGVDTVTRLSIFSLRKKMARLIRAPRDQVRVAHNLTELARAFVGELSTLLTKKVEKILALRLCMSEDLLAAQRSLITRLLKVRGKYLEASAVKFGFGHWEYTRYYLPKIGLIEDDKSRLAMFQALLQGALSPHMVVGVKDKLVVECLGQWIVLPPAVCCAILINDFRKFDRGFDGGIFERARPSCDALKSTVAKSALQGTRLTKSDAKKLLAVTCTVARDSGAKGHMPATPKLLWSWNREEYEVPVMTYRLHLCPQWGGSSGHTTGALAYWIGALESARKSQQSSSNLSSGSRSLVVSSEEDMIAPEDGCVVATSLFMLWRLYYDKRISAMHCMVETLEATLTEPVVGSEKGIKLSPLVMGDEFEDAWSVFVSCAVTGKPISRTKRLFGVDPLALMHTAFRWICGNTRGKKLLSQLDQLLFLESTQVSSSFFLPEWSRETYDVTGTEVRAFGRGTIKTIGKL